MDESMGGRISAAQRSRQAAGTNVKYFIHNLTHPLNLVAGVLPQALQQQRQMLVHHHLSQTHLAIQGKS